MARSERQLEGLLADMTALKSDVAKLVSAVEDIRKRPSRAAATPSMLAASLRPRPLVRARTIGTIVLSLAAVVSLVLFALATVEFAEAPPVALEPPAAIDTPPVAEPPAPASIAGDATPAPAATMPAEATSAPVPAPRERPPRVMHYVGTLTVDAEPAGDVYVNRHSVGRTPVRVDNLRAGSHLIWIEREGHRRWTRVVAVAANRISRVTATLDPVSR